MNFSVLDASYFEVFKTNEIIERSSCFGQFFYEKFDRRKGIFFSHNTTCPTFPFTLPQAPKYTDLSVHLNSDFAMWKEENNSLQATFTFKDFAQAFAFMTEVAIHAEKQNHHPNWTNVWNTVRFALNTHDAGNTVTDRDRKLAKTIDQIFQKYS